MNKLTFSLFFTVAAIQYAKCKIRDDRNLDWKMDAFNKYAASGAYEVDKMTAKTDHDILMGQRIMNHVAGDIKKAVFHVEIAMKYNTRNNIQGKRLYEISHEGADLLDWIEKVKSDPENRLEKIKQAVHRYTKLVREVAEAIPNLKESTENYKLAEEFCMHVVHLSMISMKKLTRRLETKRVTDVDLLGQLKKVVAEDIKLLDELQTEELDEVVLHIVQLEYSIKTMVGILEETLPTIKDHNVKAATKKTIADFLAIIAQIERVAKPDMPLQHMKAQLKIWLSGIFQTMSTLLDSSKDHGEDYKELVRPLLIECFVINYETLFKELAENK